MLAQIGFERPGLGVIDFAGMTRQRLHKIASC
jgi:hypothetical protein